MLTIVGTWALITGQMYQQTAVGIVKGTRYFNVDVLCYRIVQFLYYVDYDPGTVKPFKMAFGTYDWTGTSSRGAYPYSDWPYLPVVDYITHPIAFQFSIVVDSLSILLAGIFVISLLVLRRVYIKRTALGLSNCPVCRYDLRGSGQSDNCPECGTVIGPATKDVLNALSEKDKQAAM
jgi:hypothetical protein